MHMTKRHAAAIAAGAFWVGTAGAVPAVADSPTDEVPRHGSDMAELHEQMMDGNPDMARMHEQMMGGEPSVHECDHTR